MIIEYRFSSPEGDISAGATELAAPFKITPGRNHPSLTVGDYFETIQAFVLKDDGRALIPVLQALFNGPTNPDQIDRLLIRSEKHGALYHLASVEILSGTHAAKFAVSTAVTQESKDWLALERKVIAHLNERLNLPYLPDIYFNADMDCRAEGEVVTLSMLLAQWFDDHHEWHLSLDETARQGVRIWDREAGDFFASDEERFHIYREASRILTLYYDPDDFSQIYPWHHAAGDFVVSGKGSPMTMRLTTARGYKPMMHFTLEGKAGPLAAAVYFLLNLTVRMRLDKLDGMGDAAWAAGDCVEAVCRGFFDALSRMEGEGRWKAAPLGDLFTLLNSFSPEELRGLYEPLMEIYAEEDPEDFLLIRKHLDRHVRRLCRVLKSSRL
jgi:hypothetical protein